MSVQPTWWHEQCLANYEESVLRMADNLRREIKNYRRHKDELTFAREQLAKAKAMGKAGYDSDKFMKKRVKK